jgi:hypothetical protein
LDVTARVLEDLGDGMINALMWDSDILKGGDAGSQSKLSA